MKVIDEQGFAWKECIIYIADYNQKTLSGFQVIIWIELYLLSLI